MSAADVTHFRSNLIAVTLYRLVHSPHVALEEDERAVVAALRRRDAHAFDTMYKRYHPRIWAFLVRLTRHRAEAEDLFQETWLAAARHAHRLDPESELVPWLFSIARNKYRGSRRFLLFDLRRKERFALEPQPTPLAPDEAAHLRARAEDLERAFESLDEIHREVLLLTMVEGFDTRQVAQVLGLREWRKEARVSRSRGARSTPSMKDVHTPLARNSHMSHQDEDSLQIRIELPTPPIDPEFAARVGQKARARYRAEHWPRPDERRIPALLLMTGLFYTAISIERMLEIFSG